MRLLGLLSRRFQAEVLLVCRRPLLAGAPIPDDVRARYEFAVLDRQQLLSSCEVPELELLSQAVERSLRANDVCVGVLDQRRVASYCWYALSGHAPLSASLDIHFDPSCQVYAYRMLTLPSHRGRRLPLYCATFADAELLRRGYTHSIGYVRAQNLASRRALSRIPQNQTVGAVLYVVLFDKLFSFVTAGARRYGIRIVSTPHQIHARESRADPIRQRLTTHL
jgi:hypothetical protein